MMKPANSLLLLASLLLWMPALADAQQSAYPNHSSIPVIRNKPIVPVQPVRFRFQDQDQTIQKSGQQKIEDYLRPIHRVTADGDSELPVVSEDVDRPKAVQPPVAQETPRSFWPATAMAWQIPDSCHQPLYYEDPCLERHGYHRGLWQTPFSAGRFLLDTAFHPVERIRYPYHRCYYYPVDRYMDSNLFGY